MNSSNLPNSFFSSLILAFLFTFLGSMGCLRYLKDNHFRVSNAFRDRELWRHYFSLRFESDGIWSPLLNPTRPDRMVAVSGDGCATIYQKYGADIVTLGNSQSSRSLIPVQIQTQFGERASVSG